MKKALVLLVGVLVLWSLPTLAGEYLMNDTGGTVFGLRVVFAEPVEITGFGDVLLSVEPSGESSEVVFSGGELEAWEGHWLNWEPSGVPITRHEWILGGTETADQPAKPIDQLSSIPDVYLYVPKISYTPQEKRCLDCKTFAIVAVMSYYGVDVPFADICREVGEPPGAVFADVDHFRRLIRFVESKGLLVEPHYWTVDRILEEVKAGRPVIASHWFIDGYEPGVVKGFDESHLWVWGVQEYIQQRSKDSVYTHAEFQTLLENRNPDKGMMGYVPSLFKGPVNCIVVYKPSAKPRSNPYPITAAYYSERGSQEGGGPGAVRELNLAHDGTMSWSTPLSSGEVVPVSFSVLDESYITGSGSAATVRFAVRFFPGSSTAGTVITGAAESEKRIWPNAYGYIFEEITVPVRRCGTAWCGQVEIRPTTEVESIYVLGKDGAFFGYSVDVPFVDTETTLGSAESTPGSIDCSARTEVEWSNTEPLVTDPRGDTQETNADIVSLQCLVDGGCLYARLTVAGSANSAQGRVRFSVYLESSEWSVGTQYGLHSDDTSLYGPAGRIAPILVEIGESVEFAVPLQLIGYPSSVLVKAEARPTGGTWADRYDDTGDWRQLELPSDDN